MGSLGRLDAHTKGLDLLLDGFAAYVAQGGQGHLTLAGDGPDRAALEKQVQRLGIASVVTFLGEVHGEAKRAFLMETDVLAQLSRHEGLPGAPLEAAALGCPLLISEGTHLGESVRTHGAGKVLESCSPESVAEGLIWFAACTDEVNLRLARGARAMIERDYSWAERTRRMERDLYRLQPPEHPPAEAA
ncbi:MAG: glycosyltransferase family 4 protein [Planctomycetota bacterium]